MSRIDVESLVGKRFGKLTVIKNLGVQSNGRSLLRVKCDCGTEQDVYWFLIQKGKSDCGMRCFLRKENLIGKKINYLTVKGHTYNAKGRFEWICECDCGKIVHVDEHDLKNGHTKSCGCYWSKAIKKACIKHNMSNSKIYYVYKTMKQRCYNPSSHNYKNYGARGIKVYPEWLGDNGFINFLNWSIANNYKEGLTIERIDVNKDYSPENCKWIPLREQFYNKTDTRYILYKGESKSLAKWCNELNLSYKKVASRLNRGWSSEKAFETP